MKKLKAGFKAAVAFVKGHPIALVVILLLGGMFVIPFLFWAWNKARAALPASVQAVVPVGAAKVTPPA